jgi:uncharacterized protein YciI
MEFLVLAYDGTDPGATARRDAARPQHRVLADKMSADGTYLFTAALLDDQGRMNGSVLVCDFPSRAELDAWLAVEPYVTGKVWEKIEVRPCQPGLAFRKKPA